MFENLFLIIISIYLSALRNSVNTTVGSVGILIGPRVLKSLNNIEKIQPWLMVATFNGNPSATIISCYNSTNVSEETDLIAFYDNLSSLVFSISKHNVLVIGGDLNAQIRKNVNHKLSLHNSSNGNGQHLRDFTPKIYINIPQFKLSEKKRKTMDLHQRK